MDETPGRRADGDARIIGVHRALDAVVGRLFLALAVAAVAAVRRAPIVAAPVFDVLGAVAVRAVARRVRTRDHGRPGSRRTSVGVGRGESFQLVAVAVA